MPGGAVSHDAGLGRKIAGRVGGNGAGDAIVVSLHRLIHTLGQRQVGNRVVGIAQSVSHPVERRLLGCGSAAGRPGGPHG